MTLDASKVPAIVTVTNANVAGKITDTNPEPINEGKAFLQLFKTNLKVELAVGDVVKLKATKSDELLYYMLLNGKEGLKVETADAE